MLRKIFTQNLGLNLFDVARNTQTQKYFNLYIKSLLWSKDELINYQVNNIKELLKYSYNNVSFYKQRFQEASFNYEKFKYLDQLKNIPPLTRKDLQNNLTDLLSIEKDLSKCKKGSSSGSTGSPIIYYHDLDELSSGRAAVLFCKVLGGYNLGDRWLNIWGNPTAVNVEWKRMGSKISKFVFNEIRFPAYKLNSEIEFKNLSNLILRKRPKYIYGYTNAIYLLAEFLDKNNIKIDFVYGVFTTAENLHDFQRVVIEKNLGKVYDHYGSSEISGIAAQTTFDKNYNIISPRVFCEFGDIVDNSVNARKIMLTSFYNKVLPFLRYENGDLAVEGEKVKNNINFQIFKSIEGRTSDIIKLPSGGSLVVPSFFGSRMLKNISGIVQYQIVKREKDLLDVNLVVNSDFNNDSKIIIHKTLNEYLPKELKYNLIFNKPLIHSKNNKFKLFVDLSNSDF